MNSTKPKYEYQNNLSLKSNAREVKAVNSVDVVLLAVTYVVEFADGT